MVKKSLKKKEEKKIQIYKNYFKIINNLKIKIKYCKIYKERWDLISKLQSFPKNSILIRQKNRCYISGKTRAFLRKFGLCRIKFRELAMNGEIPGLLKSSW